MTSQKLTLLQFWLKLLGLDMKFMGKVYPILISTSNVKELHVLEKTEKGVHVGASTTMAELEIFLKDIIKQEQSL